MTISCSVNHQNLALSYMVSIASTRSTYSMDPFILHLVPKPPYPHTTYHKFGQIDLYAHSYEPTSSLILCDSQVKFVKEVLEKFCFASRLKFNVEKSQFYASKSVSNIKRDQYTSIIGFPYASNLGKYLGSPILIGWVSKRDFNYVLDGVNSKLVGWKSKLLNRATRVTLAQFVITYIPSYTTSYFLFHSKNCEIYIGDVVVLRHTKSPLIIM